MEPRGIRNNNPLNIRHGSKWQGLRPEQTDKCFCQFVSMEYGLRAAFRLLRNYISGWGGTRKPCKNIHDIVSRWAPESENNTRAYIDFVCKHTQIDAFQTISFSDRKTMIAIVDAMAQVECGRQLDINLISSAYDLAR